MKKITSLTLGLSFLIMTYTGIMLFICPHGRVAYWSDWYLLGLSKTDYGNIHTTSMLVFIVFGILHIYYNWKVIIKYLKNAQKKISFTKKEFLIALGINLFFLSGTLLDIQPFKGFLSFEESIKDSWTKIYGEPPYGHAEETKLNVFCKKMNIDLKKASQILHNHNIAFEENETLKSIAHHNDITPSQIYEWIKNKDQKEDSDTPSNLGRKTLEELSVLKKINLQASLKFLKSSGIDDIDSKSRMKNIADELDMTPLELYHKLIQLNKVDN